MICRFRPRCPVTLPRVRRDRRRNHQCRRPRPADRECRPGRPRLGFRMHRSAGSTQSAANPFCEPRHHNGDKQRKGPREDGRVGARRSAELLLNLVLWHRRCGRLSCHPRPDRGPRRTDPCRLEHYDARYSASRRRPPRRTLRSVRTAPSTSSRPAYRRGMMGFTARPPPLSLCALLPIWVQEQNQDARRSPGRGWPWERGAV